MERNRIDGVSQVPHVNRTSQFPRDAIAAWAAASRAIGTRYGEQLT